MRFFTLFLLLLTKVLLLLGFGLLSITPNYLSSMVASYTISMFSISNAPYFAIGDIFALFQQACNNKVGFALILPCFLQALFFGGEDNLPSFLARHTLPGLGIVVDPCAAVLILLVTLLLCLGIKEVCAFSNKYLGVTS